MSVIDRPVEIEEEILVTEEPLTEKQIAVIDLLSKARAVVQAGWVQGSYYEAGNYCAVGALGRAAHMTGIGFSSDPLYIRGTARRVLSKVVDPKSYNKRPHSVITNWNDTRGRTKEQILAGFDRAIERVRIHGCD